MEPDDRLELLVLFVVVAALGIHFFNLPRLILEFGLDIGISFVISGVFYALLMAAGLGQLEDIQIAGFISGMTVAVFVVKHLFM